MQTTYDKQKKPYTQTNLEIQVLSVFIINIYDSVSCLYSYFNILMWNCKQILVW